MKIMQFQEAFQNTLAAFQSAKTYYNTDQITEEENKHVLAFLTIQYTLLKLEEILSEADPHENATYSDYLLLKHFLSSYWRIICGTDRVYFNIPNSQISKVCVAMALDLAQQTDLPAKELINDPNKIHLAYSLLVPPLELIKTRLHIAGDQNGTIEGTQSTLDESLPRLSTFILSDDEHELIDVIASITAAIENECKPRYTSFKKADVNLTKDEKARLRAHSPLAHACLTKLTEYLKEKNKGLTFACFVNNLAEGLIEGGKEGNEGGTEELAASPANLAIAEFKEFLDHLDADEKSILLALPVSDDEDDGDFAELLDKLSNPVLPKGDEEQDTTFCVDTIGTDVHRFLMHNIEFLQLNIPKHLKDQNIDFNAELLKEKKAELQKLKQDLINSEFNEVQIDSSYGDEGWHDLAINLLRTKNVFKYLYDHYTAHEKEKLLRYIDDHFIPTVKSITPSSRFNFIYLIGESYPKLIKNFDDFLMLIDLIPAREKGKIAELFTTHHADYFQSLFRNIDDVRKFLHCHEREHRDCLLEKLDKKIIGSFIQTPDDLCEFLHAFSEHKRKKVLHYLGDEVFNRMKFNLDDMILFASLFPFHSRRDMIHLCQNQPVEMNKLGGVHVFGFYAKTPEYSEEDSRSERRYQLR